MTDFCADTYIIDLVYVLGVIGVLIIHYYHVSGRSNKWNYILILVECVHVILLLYWFNLRHSGYDNMWNTGNLKSYSVGFIGLEIIVMLIFALIFHAGKERTDELNNDSIAEALLYLPTGLCYSEPDGQIVLENMQMQDIWYKHTGRIMTDANEAWSHLESDISEDGLFHLGNGTVWNIERERVDIERHGYIMTRADDVTELNHLMTELDTTNKVLAAQNRKTRDIILNIAKINEEEERLDIQRRIHHEIGQCIISANRFINDIEDDDAWNTLLSMWERVFQGNLELEEIGDMKEKENEIIEAATLSACNVHFLGEAPEDNRKYLLYLEAVREAVTNAIRHGRAENVYVKGFENDTATDSNMGDVSDNAGLNHTGLTISITNDGVAPIKPIEEGVGLGKLREKLDRSGIGMEIRYDQGMEILLYFT